MIAVVWVLLGGVTGGGLYGTGRIMARDDMPLSRPTRRQQLGDLVDGASGLLSLGGQLMHSLLCSRPGGHRA